MSDVLGSIPPPDPQVRATAQAAARERRDESALTVLLALGQLVFAAALGQWAASGWADYGSELATHASVGMVLVLIDAHVAGHGALLVFGGVALLSMLPRLFRRASAPPNRRGEETIGKALMFGIVVVHGVVLVAGALLLCLLLAWSSEAAGIGAWWRFALAALLLTPLTARILLAWSRSDL